MHDHHAHHHHGVTQPQALRVSLLGVSSGTRLLGAAALCALLWLAVFAVLN
jgi:hypothetical protein